jgi:hypothetical protein
MFGWIFKMLSHQRVLNNVQDGIVWFFHMHHIFQKKGRKWFSGIENIVVEQRPESQGGRWFYQKRLK